MSALATERTAEPRADAGVVAPTFVGIGSARCGSTWLAEALRGHPGVHMSRHKQLEYFDKRIFTRGLDWYSSYFEGENGARPPAVRGEISPRYARLSPASAARLRELSPECRIVLTIRNPVDRIWSHAVYHFAQEVKRDATRVRAREFRAYFEYPPTRDFTDYERIIDVWESVFGAGAVHVEVFDDFVSEQPSFFRRVIEHIGADPSVGVPEPVSGTKVHSASSYAKANVELTAALRGRLAASWLEPTRRLNDRLAGRVSGWIEDLERRAADAPRTDRAMRQLERWTICLPKRVAYRGHAALRELRLSKRWAQVKREAGL